MDGPECYLLQRRLADRDGARWRTMARLSTAPHMELARRVAQLVQQIDPDVEWRVVPDAKDAARAPPGASLLRWHGTVGYARHDGVSVDMVQPPALSGQDIEYLPGVATRIDGRDMTQEEQGVVQSLLVKMAYDARDALAGCSTLAVIIGR